MTVSLPDQAGYRDRGGAMGELMVGVDGSDGSRAALAWAVDEARLRGDDLTVATVVHPPALQPSQAGSAKEYREHAEQDPARRAGVLLDDMVAPYANADVSITPVVLQDGATFQALIRRASRTGGLVVGSRGLGTYRRLLLGSVSQQVAVHAQTTVVVVPHPAADRQRRDRVIVGIDRSEGARVALRQASAEASMRGCELEVVMVQPPPPAAGDRPPAQAAIDAYLWTGVLSPSSLDPGVDVQRHREQVIANWRGAAEAQLRDELARVDQTGLPDKVTTTVIGARHAARALLDMAEWASLLVVGRRGRGGFAGMLLGSVSQHCVRHATSPVMVVPADPA